MHPVSIPYGDSPSQNLDLYLPKQLGKGRSSERVKPRIPLLIFIHGGAWIGGDKSSYGAVATRFANDGLAVALVNYRLSPAVQNPEHVRDGAKAYSVLVAEASKYGYDPERIFLSGHSAGAHNAAMIATGDYLQSANVPARDLPKGFIGLEGIYDIPDLQSKFPTYQGWFLEKAFGPDTNWPEASPRRRPIKILAPWLVVQSTQDTLVDQSQADKFAAHLKEGGVQVTIQSAALGDHDAVVTSMSEMSNQTALEILKFIVDKT
jgi:acetyl esterase/lipase